MMYNDVHAGVDVKGRMPIGCHDPESALCDVQLAVDLHVAIRDAFGEAICNEITRLLWPQKEE